ncbi:hypothetical protein ACFXPS_27920 [Nocardia sp. NPDC059091]|uniref:hypothetical protein n=1 Tax=unclassified Nocardia TaxID=2637762 RepID=UPI0036C1E252
MARTPRDLSALLDVMAGLGPLTLGVAYQLTLPPRATSGSATSRSWSSMNTRSFRSGPLCARE